MRRALRAGRIVLGDRRIPKSVRWVGGLAALPIPGPFDEIVLLVVFAVLAVFYRRPLRDAWAQAI
jgi:hypothetical protein